MLENFGPNGEIPSHRHTYYLVDTRNNAIVAEIPMKSVSYSNVLSGVGEASGTVMLNDETTKLNLWQITEPPKYALYIQRDNKIVWGGIIWKQDYTGPGRALRLVAKTFESYFYKRFMDTTKYWSQEDQLEMARWLVEHNNIAADILIDVSNLTSPRLRERVMFYYEYKTVGAELEALGALIDGFDWNVDVYKDGDSAIRRKLNFHYPYAGKTLNQSTLVFEYPGSIKRFRLSRTADDAGNVVTAIGVGEGTEQVTETVRDEASLAEGWPMLEVSRSYKSVTYPSTLRAHASADLERLKPPITIFEVSVAPDIEPQYGTYVLGDWARFRITDHFIQAKFDSAARITEINVTVDDGSGLEDIALTLGGEKEPQDDQPAIL